MAAAPPLAALVRRITPGPDTVSDAELIDRFLRADQAAFELLVWRHGAMVWGVCRRMLGPDRDAAEDACQAAFVALASHAARVRDRDSLAAWLHRVAVRASLDLIATRRAVRPLSPDLLDPPDHHADPSREASDREVRTLLDTGLNRLPDKLRVPFVLCELEGRSNAEAAAALGCPVGTVESRLTRARQKLRSWLTARGVVPAVAAAAVALPESARAAMVKAGVPGAVESVVRALAARAIPSVVSAKLRLVAAAGLVLAVSAVGLGLTAGEQPKPADPPPAKLADGKPPVAERKDADAPPLPAGAVTRLGSPRLRHPAWVKDVCFSPDGKRLASVGYDKALRVWDAVTGNQVFAVRREKGEFDKVSFADEGKVIVAVGREGGEKGDLWRVDARTGEVTELTLPGTILKESAFRFNRDGSRLAVARSVGKRNELLVIHTFNGQPTWGAGLGNAAPRGVAFSRDGKTVAVSTAAGTVELFDAEGRPANTMKAEDTSLSTVALSPDGNMVLARNEQSPSRELIAWDRATGKILWKQQHAGETGLAFTPDARRIVACSSGSSACTLDPADGIPPGLGGKQGARFESMVSSTCLALSPDGKVVAFGNISGPICLFDTETGQPVHPTADPPHEVRWMRFSADGKTLYGWAADWFAWDVATGKQTRVTNAGWNYGVPLSPDGKFTARNVWYTGARPAGSEDDGTRFEICDAATGKVVHSHRGKGFSGLGWKDFTPDGKAVAVSSHDGTIRVCAIDDGKELVKMTGHQGTPQYRAFSADGRVLVTATLNSPPEEFSVRVWELKTGKELAKFAPGTGVVGVAASDDGRRVAALAYTNAAGKPDPRHQATVWDVATGKVLARVPQGGDGGEIALSPDGRLVAVSARWKTDVRVYEVASGAERFVFKHEGTITGLAFAPNGRTLAAASQEAPIYLWDVTGDLGGAPPAWDATAADKVWDELSSKDAAKAFAAIRLLRANGEKAVALLKDRAKLPAAPDANTLKKLFTDLASEDFPTREKATEALAGFGEVVRKAIEAEFARNESPEAKNRLRDLLTRLDALTPARFRLIRAVEAVEGIDTPEAKALLEAWAGGSAGATLAAEAKAALGRRGK
jgi:RNA polymerase sigma factor (sigma-70 family)